MFNFTQRTGWERFVDIVERAAKVPQLWEGVIYGSSEVLHNDQMALSEYRSAVKDPRLVLRYIQELRAGVDGAKQEQA